MVVLNFAPKSPQKRRNLYKTNVIQAIFLLSYLWITAYAENPVAQNAYFIGFSDKFSYNPPMWVLNFTPKSQIALNNYDSSFIVCDPMCGEITTKYAGGSAHCQDNMLPRGRCFPRINPSSAHIFSVRRGH